MLLLALHPAVIVNLVAVARIEIHGLAHGDLGLRPVLVLHEDQAQQAVCIGVIGLGSQGLPHLIHGHIQAPGLKVIGSQLQANLCTAIGIGDLGPARANHRSLGYGRRGSGGGRCRSTTHKCRDRNRYPPPGQQAPMLPNRSLYHCPH